MTYLFSSPTHASTLVGGHLALTRLYTPADFQPTQSSMHTCAISSVCGNPPPPKTVHTDPHTAPGTLDAGGHCVLEMPSGTGKTVSLLSLIVAYQQYYPEKRKLIYCSRTMSEIEKALAELKALMKYRADELGYEEEFRGLGLTSRKNLCLHPSVKREKTGTVVDARCRSLTAGFVKEKKDRGEDVDVCVYHDVRHDRLPLRLLAPAHHYHRILTSSNPTISFPMASGPSTASCATASNTSSAPISPHAAW